MREEFWGAGKFLRVSWLRKKHSEVILRVSYLIKNAGVHELDKKVTWKTTLLSN
jgi:hypothetical protein